MSEDVIHCSKCGAALTGDTCNNCGAAGQAITCEHCSALCPGDARWCPSCGRHLAARQQETAAPAKDAAVAPGGSTVRLLLLLGLTIVLCALIWRLQPVPACAVLGALALTAALPAASLQSRLRRAAPFLLGGALAAGIVHLTAGAGPSTSKSPVLLPISTESSSRAADASRPDGAPAPREPGVILARFTDNGADEPKVAAAVRNAELRSEKKAPFEASTEELDPDTHVVKIDFDPAIPVQTALYELRRLGGLVYAEPDYIYQALYTPNDPHYDEPYESSAGPLTQWYLKTIQAPEAWDSLKSVKSDIRVAIIDTGIDYTHPDLKPRMAHDSKGQLLAKNFVQTRRSAIDDNGHGTHCAGIACAETDNSTGGAGVGFNSFQLVAAKVLTGAGYGEVGAICKAIVWCADNGCRVESMSLGGPIYSQAIQDAINYAWSKGVIVVAAAGNSSSSSPGYPAGCNHVVAVSATDESDNLAWFSNYGTPVAVGAPGVRILSTMPSYDCNLTKKHGLKKNYDALNGTSMACPVVAGVMGAVLAYQPTLTRDQAIQRVEASADNVGGTAGGGWDVRFGHGRVNLANAIANKPREAAVGSLYGQVVTDQGRSVPGASVRCGESMVTTQRDGMFRLANLAPGNYTVEVTLNGRTVNASAAVLPGADECLTIKMPASG